ncbi:MAG: alanine racemase, partial [Clostridia bacterium]
SVHIKIDTGMSRMGFVYDNNNLQNQNTLKDIKNIFNFKGLILNGIYTHFSHSDSFDESAKQFTKAQYENFRDIIKILENDNLKFKTIHCQNSGAIEYGVFDICTHGRPGIILYGLAPSREYNNLFSLKPVMSLKSTITAIKELKKDSFISYSRKFKTTKDIKVAIIPAGYADGYFRDFYKQGYVLIHGKKAKIVGVICMDQFMVDVTDFEDVKEGNLVILMGCAEYGEKITADQMASWSDTINYEIVCGVSRRVPRVYIKNQEIIDYVSYL